MSWMDERDMAAMERELARYKSKEEKGKFEKAEMFREGKAAVEIGAASIGLAYANARFAPDGEYKVGPVPVDLLVGVGFHLLAFAPGVIPEKYQEDMHNLGNGAIAEYLARLGTKLGNDAKNATSSAPATGTAGLFGAGAQRHPYAGHQFSVPVR